MNLLLILFLSIFKIGGFFEYQGQGTKKSDSIFYTSYNRLNFTLSGKLEGVYFRTDLVYTDYNGKVHYKLSDYLPSNFVFPDTTYCMDSGFHIRNGFIRLKDGPFIAELGRQQIGWGTGYAYNPTNVFQMKSILDPTYELDGVDALHLNFYISPFWEIEGLFLPKETLKSSARGGKIKGTILGNLDISFGYLFFLREKFNPEDFLSKKEEVGLVTGDFSGEMMGLGLHGEGTYSLKGGRSITLLGLDYTFKDAITSILFEYLRNGEGREKGNYSLSDWLDYLEGLTLSMGKNEIFIDIERILGFHTIHISGVFNPNDKSGIFIPRLNFSLNDNTQFVLSPYLTFGKEGKEYSTLPDGLIFRVRYSF